MNNEIEMKQQIEECISDFIINDFQKHPKDFFSEADVRAVLYTRLKDRITIRRKFRSEEINGRPIGDELDTDLIKCEYNYEKSIKTEKGRNKPTATKFDIAVLQEEIWVGSEYWEKYFDPTKRNAQMYWNQPVRFGIEIKSVWHEWERINGINRALEDRKKLRDYLKNDYWQEYFKSNQQFPFDGVAILFVTDSDDIPPDFDDTSSEPLTLNQFSACLSNPPEAYYIAPTKIYKIINPRQP